MRLTIPGFAGLNLLAPQRLEDAEAWISELQMVQTLKLALNF